MNSIYLFFVVLVFLTLQAEPKQHPQAHLPFVEYCRYFHYPIQTHIITTEDGYILTTYRIQKRFTIIKQQGLPPILLQHGLMDSSDTFIVNDLQKAPALILADAGYDVWLGNSRGNKYSRAHTVYNPDKDTEYWMFSFQHMAKYDLPANFLYIHNKTQQKLHYLGHSQGTTIMFAALADNNPVVEQFVHKCFHFGPIAYNSNQESKIMDIFQSKQGLQWFKIRHIHEIMPSPGWFKTDAGIYFCSIFRKICTDFMGEMMDADPRLDNYVRQDVIVGHNPAGTSLMNLQNWVQNFRQNTFKAYDYGKPEQNIKHYGQKTPPAWDLSKIRIPQNIFTGTSDMASDPTDVERLWQELSPASRGSRRLYNAGHATFNWGISTYPWMYDLLMKELPDF